MKDYKIAIVGGSISGCAVAIILHRLGFNVSIFEKRTKGAMLDRGAGLALPMELVNQLIEDDLFDQDFLKLYSKERIFFTIDKATRVACELTRQPLNAYLQHWSSLYQSLVKRVPEKIIHYNTKITTIKVLGDNKIALATNNKHVYSFDIIIFADGYNSIGRKQLFPDAKVTRTNYIAWRGTTDNISLNEIDKMRGVVPFYLYEKGHALFGLIPIVNTKHREDNIAISWLVYEMLYENHPLVRDNKVDENISLGTMPKEYINYLHEFAKTMLPPFAEKIILQTEKPFLQAIYDVSVPSMFKNNMALIGDAGILVRPHTASGATKSLQDVLYLKECLQQESDVVKAFQLWNKERYPISKQLCLLGQSLGELLVTNTPDWEKVDKQKMDELWQAAIEGHNWYASK